MCISAAGDAAALCVQAAIEEAAAKQAQQPWAASPQSARPLQQRCDNARVAAHTSSSCWNKQIMLVCGCSSCMANCKFLLC